MYNNSRFSWTRSGKNKTVAAALVGNNGFLHLIQPICNFAQGLWRCRLVQFFQTTFKPFIFKILFFQAKVITHQIQPFSKIFQCAKGIFLHHMDLKAFFAVKNGKRFIVLCEILAFSWECFWIGCDSHGMSQNGHAVVEFDNALFVHKQQCLPE